MTDPLNTPAPTLAYGDTPAPPIYFDNIPPVPSVPVDVPIAPVPEASMPVTASVPDAPVRLVSTPSMAWDAVRGVYTTDSINAPAQAVTVTPVETLSPVISAPLTPVAPPAVATLAPVKTSAAIAGNTPSHQFLVLMEGIAVSAIGGAATGALAAIGGVTGDTGLTRDAWFAFAAAVAISAVHSAAAWVVTRTTNKA